MSRRLVPYLALAALPAVLALPPALGHGVTPHVEGIEIAIDARLAQLPAEDPAAKALAKAAKALSKPANGKSLAAELSGVAKAEAAVLKGAPGESGVLDVFGVAREAYRGDLATAHATAVAAQSAQGLKKSVAKKLAKAVTALETVPDTFGGLSKLAEKAAGWTPYDAGESYSYVVGSLTVAPEGEGFDLDQDGDVDNGIASIRESVEGFAGQSLDQILADGLAQGGGVLLLEVFHAGPLQRDKLAFAGFVSGTDTDGDATDNLSGSETFGVDPALLAADGHAAVRAATSISKGAFRARLDGASLPVGGGANGLLAVSGTISTDGASGRIGAAIPTDVLVGALADAGITIPALLLPTLRAAADLDLDGDGVRDAFSIALDYTAAPATFVPETP